jgi:hypothetical protein
LETSDRLLDVTRFPLVVWMTLVSDEVKCVYVRLII